MKFNVKTTLLAGASILAVGALTSPAQAAVVAQTLTGNVEWAADANQNQSPADGSGAAASDTVNLATHTLTVTNDATNDDGGGVNTFTLGAVTGTTGDLVITDGAVANLVTTIASFATTSTGDFSVTGQDANTANITVTVTDDLVTGGALSIVNTETSSGDDLLLTVGDDLTVAGITTLTAGANAGATSALTVTGDAAFTGAVTVTGGVGAGSLATLTLNGATNAFTGGLSLATASKSTLTVSSTSAQTISGAITGSGVITVNNSATAGATFTGAVTAGSITVEKTDGNSSATFKSGVTVTSITLGTDGSADDVNTVTFDGTTAGFTVAGTVNGTATEVDNVVVSGGNTIVQSGIWGGSTTLDNLTVSGSGTILDSNAAITSAATTIGSGATLDVGSGLLTSAVANTGTLLLSGTGGVTGNITGAGALDVNANASVTGNIAQGSTTVAEGSTLTVVGAASRTVTTNILLEDATSNGTDAGVTFDNGANTTTYTGNITTGVDGEGLVTFADDAGATLALVGNVGTSAVKVGTLAVAGAGAQTLTTTGDLYVNAITVNDADTLQFLGTTAQTVSGTITDGILTVGNGTTTSDVTFSGALSSMASATVSANAVARYNANATAVGAYTNTGTSKVGVGATLSAVSLSDTGSYVLDANDANLTLAAADFGLMTDNGGGVSTITNSRLSINVTGDMGTGTVQLLTNANAGAGTLADNSFQYSFVTANNGANTDVTVTRATINSMGDTGANDSVGTVLDSLTATTNTQLAAVIDNIAAANSRAAVNEVVESVLPSVDAGATGTALNASVQSLGVTGSRMDALRTGSGDTGMSSGEMSNGMTAWVQGFGKAGEQDLRDGVDGYDADTYGIAVGMDTADGLEGGTVGLSLSYANSDIESENANTTESDVDSYQVSLYGDMDVAENTYLAGTLAYARNNIDQVRHNVGGISGTNAAADYSSDQYIVFAEAGRSYPVGGNAVITPSVLAHYQHIATDDYTETGAGGANLSVDNDGLNIFELGVGAEIAWNLQDQSGAAIKPALNVGYRHDLVGDEVESTSTFTGGGASFNTQGVDPAQGTFNVGGSVGYSLDNNWEVTADYDYEVKSDYDAHSGYIRAGYKF